MKYFSPSRNHCRGKQRDGIVIILAIIVLILSSAISLTMIRTTTLRQLRFESRQRQLQAELIADAAIERARLMLLENAEYNGEVWKVELSTDAGQVTIQVHEDSSNEYAVKVVANYPIDLPDRTQKTIETIIKQPDSDENGQGES